MRGSLKKFDDFFIKLINSKMKRRHLDTFMYNITHLGGVVFTSLFVIFTIIFSIKNSRYIGFELLTSLMICQSIVYSLKLILSRERPYNILEHLNTFGIEMKDYSFPSGHTAASFSIATTISLNLPNLSIYIFTFAIIIAISRIYLGVHYPTDVAAGMILGLGISYLVHLYLLDYIKILVNIIALNYGFKIWYNGIYTIEFILRGYFLNDYDKFFKE